MIPVNINNPFNVIDLKVKKLHPNAVTPSYAHFGDAGMDLTAVTKEFDENTGCVVFGTGLAFEIPEGHVGYIFPRSSIYKTGFTLSNCVGVVDSGYRGEVKFMFYPGNRPKKNYEVGDRIGQLIIMPIPQVVIHEVEHLSDSQRGTGGFGSSGA